MRICKLASGADYRMAEGFENLRIFKVRFWFSKLEKFLNFIHFPNRIFFRNLLIFQIEFFLEIC